MTRNMLSISVLIITFSLFIFIPSSGQGGNPEENKYICKSLKCYLTYPNYPKGADECFGWWINFGTLFVCSAKDQVAGYYIYKSSNIEDCSSSSSGGDYCSYCPCENDEDRNAGRCKECSKIYKCKPAIDQWGFYYCAEEFVTSTYTAECVLYNNQTEYYVACNLPTPSPTPTPTPEPTPTEIAK